MSKRRNVESEVKAPPKIPENVRCQFDIKMFMTVPEVNKITGLGLCYLRQGCRDNVIPHITVGTGKSFRYLINVPKLLEQLEAKSMEA